MKNLEIYIHIPFCVRKCEYCDFLSFPADDDAKLRYVKGLMAEMIFYGPLMKNYQVSSVYIGGGTPSSIDKQWIAALMGGVFDCSSLFADCSPMDRRLIPASLYAKSFSLLSVPGLHSMDISASGSVTVYGDSKQDHKASSGSYIGVFSYSGKGYSFL